MGILLPLAACGGGSAPDGAGACSIASTQVTLLKVFPPEVQIATGETFQLASQAFNACGFQVTGSVLSWTSSDPAAASVDGQGRVTGNTGGRSVRVTATVVGAPGGGGLQAPGAGPDAGATVSVLATTSGAPANFDIEVYPPDPVVAVGNTLQMVAVATSPQGVRIPSVTFVWTTTHPEIANINSNTGLVQAVQPGVTSITAQAAQASSSPGTSVTLVVLADNGAPMPAPNINVSPSALVLAVGEARDAHATVSDGLTGTVIATPVTWVASASGLVTLTPLNTDGDVVRVTGATPGELQLVARATVNGTTVQSLPIGVTVLEVSGGASGPWTPVESLPYSRGVYGHGMSIVRGRLFVTGGVTGDLSSGGFREDVLRAAIRADGGLDNVLGNPGWDRSPAPSDPDPAVSVLAPCDDDPECLHIVREATGTIPEREVRFQVARHAQVAVADHIYVVGGIDAQVDLGIDPSDPGAVGPQLTRYSARVLNGTVDADGEVTWREDDALPTVLLPAGLTDVAGRSSPAVVVYRDWVYVLGGWGWAFDGLRYVGRNHDEVLRASIDPANGDLSGWSVIGRIPIPLNKLAAAVVNDWLLISGGSEGADETSPDLISDQVYVAHMDPITGDIIGGQWRPTTPLPQALEYHAMVSVPGDPRVVVVGGDNPAILSASADAYVATLDPVTGLLGAWTFLPVLPEIYGLTSLAAAAEGGPGATPAYRVYVSGGGVPISGDVTDLDRRKQVYFIDLAPL